MWLLNIKGDNMKKQFFFGMILFMFLMSIYSKGNSDMSNNLKFNYSNIEKVKINGALFDVDIKGKNVSTVSGKIETDNKVHKLYHKQEGNTLVFVYEKKGWALFNFNQKHSLSLEVPASVMIEIENSSGDLDIENINTKEIDLRTTSGDIRVDYIEADQRYKSTSGKIEIQNTIGNQNISSTSGYINISSSDGNIEADSSSGKQEFEDIRGDINASSSSGDIEIDGYAGTLKLTTSSGKIRGEDLDIISDSHLKLLLVTFL